MSAKKRRKDVLNILENQDKPISATKLADVFSVSRQIIVGDVALLRAEDNKIISTPRGYILENKLVDSGYTGKIVCFHTQEKAKEELYTIVDFGGKILDVEIDHDFYGELSGKLDISSRAEVDEFMKKISETKAKLLTELTDGVHIHTISTKDKETFMKIKQSLKEKNILYVEES